MCQQQPQLSSCYHARNTNWWTPFPGPLFTSRSLQTQQRLQQYSSLIQTNGQSSSTVRLTPQHNLSSIFLRSKYVALPSSRMYRRGPPPDITTAFHVNLHFSVTQILPLGLPLPMNVLVNWEINGVTSYQKCIRLTAGPIRHAYFWNKMFR